MDLDTAAILADLYWDTGLCDAVSGQQCGGSAWETVGMQKAPQLVLDVMFLENDRGGLTFRKKAWVVGGGRIRIFHYFDGSHYTTAWLLRTSDGDVDVDESETTRKWTSSARIWSHDNQSGDTVS